MDPAIIIWVIIPILLVVFFRVVSRGRSFRHKKIEILPPDLWLDYRGALDEYAQRLQRLSYRELPLPSAPFSPHGLPSQSLPLSQIETLLHIHDKPHGYELIEPLGLPVFPSLPPQPPTDQPLPLWRRIFWAPPK